MSDRHEDHDLERLVAYVDDELDPVEAQAAGAQLAICADCARLADDLRTLAVADRRLSTPPRPRDFRLTPADAARITGLAAEPVVLGTRLVDEMHHDRTAPAAHATHDAALVAASVDDALTLDQRRTVDAWLAACTACDDLRTDLLAIAAAHRTLPTPARPRDFRLTAQDASRLRVARWRDLLAWIGGTHDGITRPLAAGLTTLGLVGVLITGTPAMFSGMSSSAGAAAAPTLESAKSSDVDPGDSTVFVGNGDTPGGEQQPEASSAASNAAPAAGIGSYAPNVVSNQTDPSPLEIAASDPADRSATSQATIGDGSRETLAVEPPPVGLIASLVALGIGVLLFVARRFTRPLRGI